MISVIEFVFFICGGFCKRKKEKKEEDLVECIYLLLDCIDLHKKQKKLCIN